MENKKYFMYVLLCSDGSFYGGFTTNVSKRVETHNAGKGAKYTKLRRPVKLLYQEAYQTKSEALKAEYAFKHQSRKAKEKYLIEHGVSIQKWQYL
ncbi:GIY-YIG nuclease family protein [Ligilactobacillus sp. LYQ135]